MCIGYLHAINKGGEARTLSGNVQTIRRSLLHREEQPMPAGSAAQHGKET
jgi:hypothetical protein